MKAGFSEVDITPPLGTKKGGWMADLAAEHILDPLYAKVAVFDDGAARIAFMALDLLSVRWTQVNDIRRRVQAEYGFPGENIMVSATHNHAGPAISNLDPVKRQEAYVEALTGKCVDAFGRALNSLTDAAVGFDHELETRISYNRRILTRDGQVKTHGNRLRDRRDILGVEGPIDPEVAVLAVKDRAGKLMGCLMNFACHPLHEGGGTNISAGYPGRFSALMRQRDCPAALFLNGAYANISPVDHLQSKDHSMEEMGEVLADHATRLIGSMAYDGEAELGAASETVILDHRAQTADECHGRVFGAQRFRPDELYDGYIRRFQESIERKVKQPAELQVLRVGNQYFAGIPAEYFVEFQLDIKLRTHPKHALVVGGANGMVGYLPTWAAFAHGGYETTFGPPSRTAIGSGERLAEGVVALIRGFPDHAGKGTRGAGILGGDVGAGGEAS